MIIFIDSDYRCHTTDDGTMQPIETDYFEGKCNEYIEGYRFVPSGEKWVRSDGAIFNGEMVVPAVNSSILEQIQMKYEFQDMMTALSLLGVSP